MAKCSKTVLTALRGAYGLTPARAATFIAAKAARVPHGPKATCIYGRLARAPAVKDGFNTILEQSQTFYYGF